MKRGTIRRAMASMPLIECVPNVSEGRRLEVVSQFAADLRRHPDLALLDCSSDPSHNRSVFTMAGHPAALERAVLAMVSRAVATIDLRLHRGEHPRLGAVDVVPFVPLGRTSMEDCVALAHTVGRSIASRFAIPVYLYGHAATDSRRGPLENIRRGQFEGLAAKMAQPEWVPDFGPAQPHPTCGATAVGARPVLIAYNVNLATDRVDLARRVARAVRESGGGLPFVKALGLTLADRGLVQVSMNLTNYATTPVHVVFDRVASEAAREGVEVAESEFIGLIPAAALNGTTATHLRLRRFSDTQILEHQLRAAGLDTWAG